MRPRGVLLCGVLLTCAGLAVGCAGWPRHPTLPDDPLLVSRKAARGRAEYTPPVLLARVEPVQPPEPMPALVAASPALREEVGTARQMLTVPVNTPRPPQPGRPPTQAPRDKRRTVTLPPPPSVTPISARGEPPAP
jgi:hypothetical protein